MSGRFFDYGLISKKTQLHHVYITAFKGDKILYYKMQDDEERITINDVINAVGKDELDKKMKKINIYIWCSKAQVRKILEHYEDKGCAIDILTWHKTNPTPTMNNTYANDTEYCIFAREKGVKIGGSYETKRKYYITGTNKADKDEYLHPTIKPLHIIKNLIINSSNENDIILDCFMGSGTTAVACKELNRQFIGFEIDEKWHKIANERLNGLTQDDVKKQESGQITLF